MVIGAFAASMYGVTRTTYDIDIVVDLNERHIQALAKAYPPPRYYADVHQMRGSVRMGIMFNIIDTNRGEKADLIPLSMVPTFRFALKNRVRQSVDTPNQPPFQIWTAQPEDIIIGKLMAWSEGRSRKHETDIYQMMVFRYLGFGDDSEFAEQRIERWAIRLGEDTHHLWQVIKAAARIEAERAAKR